MFLLKGHGKHNYVTFFLLQIMLFSKVMSYIFLELHIYLTI